METEQKKFYKKLICYCIFFFNTVTFIKTSNQTRCQRGAYWGRAPPSDCLCPPNENCVPSREDCAPKKLTGLGPLECKSRPNWCLLWTDTGFHDDFGMKTFFFFGDHLFSAGKTARICDFGRKIPLNLCSSSCLFDPDWDKFLVPPYPSRIHTK